MHIEAIYNQGRLEFPPSLKLKHQRFRVRVEVPDQAIADPAPCVLPTYDLADFSPEVRARVEDMAALAEVEHWLFMAPTDGEESDEERQRWAAVELRLAARREQGRLL